MDHNYSIVSFICGSSSVPFHLYGTNAKYLQELIVSISYSSTRHTCPPLAPTVFSIFLCHLHLPLHRSSLVHLHCSFLHLPPLFLLLFICFIIFFARTILWIFFTISLSILFSSSSCNWSVSQPKANCSSSMSKCSLSSIGRLYFISKSIPISAAINLISSLSRGDY